MKTLNTTKEDAHFYYYQAPVKKLLHTQII